MPFEPLWLVLAAAVSWIFPYRAGNRFRRNQKHNRRAQQDNDPEQASNVASAAAADGHIQRM